MTSTRFSTGRLFSDTAKVVARDWPILMVGLVVIGAPTVAAVSAVWWGPVDPADLLRVWAPPLTAAKSVVNLFGLSLYGIFLTVIALRTLDAPAMRGPWAFRAFACGLPTQLAVNLIGNGTAIVSPFLMAAWSPTMFSRWLIIGLSLAGFFLPALFWLIAVSAAVAERRLLPSAFVRSARLMRGLRWRMLAIVLVYFLLQWVSQFAVVLVLGASRSQVVFGLVLATAVGGAVALLIALPAQILFVSAFLQARRIADGPSAGELMDVFA
jgi:hypothetical protein